MCVIAIVDLKNGKKIADETIKTMYTANPHGAGFMIADGKSVVINKGFFDVNQFIKAYRKAEKHARTAVLHFRIATHGKTDASRCHPFPLTRKTRLLNATQLSCEYGIAHNGVYTADNYDSLGNEYSDTQAMIATRYFPILHSNLDSELKWKLIGTLNGNCRLVVLDKYGNYKRLGNWQECDGILYSNDSYKPKQAFTLYGGSYGWQDYKQPKYYNFTMSGKVITADNTDAFCAQHNLQKPIYNGATFALLTDGTIVKRYSVGANFWEIGTASTKEYDTLQEPEQLLRVTVKC